MDSRSRTESVFARTFDQSNGGRRPAELIVEEPLTLQLDGHVVSTTMRTPGHDFELAVGFLVTEGLVTGADVTAIRYCGTTTPTTPAAAVDSGAFNAVSVDTGGRVPEPTARLGSISSSCGICGAEAIDTLTERLSPLPNYEPWDQEQLTAAPDRMRTDQALFDATGSVHAAATVDRSGRVSVVREDIGRHNAVDKVIGRLALDGALPANDLALVVSGRASFEMVQKAWAGGFTALVAVSGPSALAVATARRAGLTLLGFARSDTAAVYSPSTLIDP